MTKNITREQFTKALNDFLANCFDGIYRDKLTCLTWEPNLLTISLVGANDEVVSMIAKNYQSNFFFVEKLSELACSYFNIPSGSIRPLGSVANGATFAIRHIDTLLLNPHVIEKVTPPLDIKKHINDEFVGNISRNESEKLLYKNNKAHLRIGNNGESLVLSQMKNGFPVHSIIVPDSKSIKSLSYNIKLYDQEEFDAFLAKGLALLQDVQQSTINTTQIPSGMPRFNFSSNQNVAEEKNDESPRLIKRP